MKFRPPRTRNCTLLFSLITEGMYAAVIENLEWFVVAGLQARAFNLSLPIISAIPVPSSPGNLYNAWPTAPPPAASAATLPGNSRIRRSRPSGCASALRRSCSGSCGPYWSSQRGTPWYRSSPPCPPGPPSDLRPPCGFLLVILEPFLVHACLDLVRALVHVLVHAPVCIPLLMLLSAMVPSPTSSSGPSKNSVV